jgi:hypothetical protein
MGVDCGAIGNAQHQKEAMEQAEKKLPIGNNGKRTRWFHSDPYKNDHKNPLYYQGIAAAAKYEE